MHHRLLVRTAAALSALAAVATGIGAVHSGASATPGPTVAPPVSGAAIAGVCGNAALLTGPASAPAGAVTIAAGASIQSAVDANPERTTFFLPGALYRITGPVTAKTGDVFVGGPATVVDGGGTAGSAFKAGRTFGTPWVMADDVTLRFLTITHFNAPDDQVVVNADAGDGWTIDRVTVTDNHGGAVMMGSRNTITRSCLTRNGQYGFNTYRCRGYGANGCTTSTTVTDLVIDGSEISYNDTERLAITNPNCGCSGGGKFWDVRGARVTNNWVHHNNSVGLWADTNDADFAFIGNVIEDNDAAGIMYEVSYNARIVGNTFRRNAIGQGSRRLAGGAGDYFPDGAIYLSESGGDSAAIAAARARGESWTQVNADQNVLEVADNAFVDNWNGVVLWESADRYCSSSANTSSSYCTLYFPSYANNGSNLAQCQGTLTVALLDMCRWKTKNVMVHNNAFSLDRSAVGNGCTATDLHCGRNAIFSQWGTYANYTGDRVQRAILFGQNNRFADNTYTGTWGFTAFDQAAASVRPFATWTAAAPASAQTAYNVWASPPHGIGQDAGSVLNGTVAPPPPTTTTVARTTTTTVAPTTSTTAAPTTSTFVPVVQSMPGVSPTTAAAAVSRVGDVTIPTTSTTATTAAPTTTTATATTAKPTTTTVAAKPTTKAAATVRYEAERATWQSLKSVSWGSGFSGTGWLTAWDKPGHVDWTVNAPATGSYTVSFHYLAPFLPAKLDVTVNGVTVASPSFATTPIVSGDWTSWAPARDITVTVTLKAGANHVRLVRPVGAPAGVSLDYLAVTGG